MFPNNKMKAVTFSYDDGVIQDVRLTEMFNKYGLKCTYNLNSGLMGPESNWAYKGKPTYRLTQAEALKIYRGHEIAMHFVTHPSPVDLSREELTKEIGADIRNHEKLFNCDIVGAAYPFGRYNDLVMDVLKKHGIKYARTVDPDPGFAICHDLLKLKPTCHHNDENLMKMAEKFLEAEPEKPMLFYIWGHSYEFDGDDNWAVMEEFCRYISGHDSVFYGTNRAVFGL